RDVCRCRAAFCQPLHPAAIQYGDLFMSIIIQAPPEACGEHALGVIIDHDEGLIVDTQAAHHGGIALWLGDLRMFYTVRVGDFMYPIHKQRAGDMALFIICLMIEIVWWWLASGNDMPAN